MVIHKVPAYKRKISTQSGRVHHVGLTGPKLAARSIKGYAVKLEQEKS